MFVLHLDSETESTLVGLLQIVTGERWGWPAMDGFSVKREWKYSQPMKPDINTGLMSCIGTRPIWFFINFLCNAVPIYFMHITWFTSRAYFKGQGARFPTISFNVWGKWKSRTLTRLKVRIHQRLDFSFILHNDLQWFSFFWFSRGWACKELELSQHSYVYRNC